VQFIDLQTQYAALKEEIDNAIHKVLDHGQFILGPEVDVLEQELSDYLNVKNVITCANGTDALQILYMVYGIGQGDAIFCPDITFIASVEPACMLGAVPVFCDVDRSTFSICPHSLERQIQSVQQEGRYNPRAIVAVDFLGNPADYQALQTIADKYDMLLIEDAAQSIGSEYLHKKCGSFGDAATTSFFPAKPLGCYGDGGAIMTNDDALAKLCKSIRVHGKGMTKYENIRIGVNSRLDTIQAAVLRVKLKALQNYEMNRRQEVANYYDTALKDYFQLPIVHQGNRSAYAQYAFLVENTALRDAIALRLKENSVPNMVYYPYPQHVLEVFQEAPIYGESFVVANDYCARTLSLPMHPYLDQEVQDIIIQTIIEVII